MKLKINNNIQQYKEINEEYNKINTTYISDMDALVFINCYVHL